MASFASPSVGAVGCRLHGSAESADVATHLSTDVAARLGLLTSL